MKKKEYFKIETVEELKQAYYMFEDKWLYSLESEVDYFNKGYKYVISDSIGIFLGDDNIPNIYKEIKHPLRNINNLNKLI